MDDNIENIRLSLTVQKLFDFPDLSRLRILKPENGGSSKGEVSVEKNLLQ
jgi:hypothetical protein